MKSLNEEEKGNKEKKHIKKLSALGKKSSDYFFLNIVSHLFNNIKVFKEKIDPKYLDFILFTDSSISLIDKLNYELKIAYSLFDEKLNKIKKEDITSRLKFEDEYEKKETVFINIAIDLTPKLLLNHYLDLSNISFQYYNHKSHTKEKYEIKANINNNKFRLIFCLKDFNKNISKDIENLKKTIDDLFDYFEDIYIIFQAKTLKKSTEIIDEINGIEFGNNLSIIRELKGKETNVVVDNKDIKEVKYLFNIIHDNNQVEENIYNFFNDYGQDYFFILDNNNEIIFIKNDMKNLVENIFKFIIPYKKLKKNYIECLHEKETAKKELNSLMKQLIYFITKLKHLNYIFDIEFNFAFSVSINEEFTDIIIKTINKIRIKGTFRTKEYQYLNNILNIIKEKSSKTEIYSNLIEVQTTDIDVDFSEMKCLKCSKIIPDDKHFYYCYFCKTKYCYECIQEQLTKKGQEKYIDKKHNLIFFKTKDIKNFKNIDKRKLGKNLFAQATNDDELDPLHSSICNGCSHNIHNQARYECLNCRPGKYLSGGYVDFCQNCIEKMCNNENDKRNLEKCADEDIDTYNNRFMAGYVYHNIHKHDDHVYLLLPLQCQSYNDY